MNDLGARKATLDDLPRVTELIDGMFVDLGTVDRPATWSAELGRAFSLRLGRDVGAYVTTATDRPIAVAVGVLDQRLPSPRRITGRVGYVEWVVTDPECRRRGAGSLALSELMRWFDEERVDLVDVYASDDAIGVYSKWGFTASHATAMRRRRPAA